MKMLDHRLPGWYCSSTVCYDDTARPQVARMTLLTDMRICFIYHILLISHPPTTIFLASEHFLCPKNIPLQRISINCIWRFFGIKTFRISFYRHKWTCKYLAEMHRCLWIIFWLIKTLFKFIHTGIKKKKILKSDIIFRTTKYIKIYSYFEQKHYHADISYQSLAVILN